MKLLYAIQGTGNGHLSRAMEIAPELMKLANVDLLMSGISAELDFPYEFKYKYHGLSFFFGNRGGVDYIKSFRHVKPYQLWKDIQSCPVQNYDAVISDFEPISAWAAKRKKVPVVAVSHQASFFSEKVPLPRFRNKFMEYGMRHIVAPSDGYVGLHYKQYDDNVMPPIIRQELQNATISDSGHITVYLPAFNDGLLTGHFNQLPDYTFQIFSKKTKKKYIIDNVTVNPVNKNHYNTSLLSCHGLIIGGGFQGTSEGLYLGKKMLVIPMFDQYEQKCNAAALQDLGVQTLKTINHKFSTIIKEWLAADIAYNYTFTPDTSKVAKKIIEVADNLLSLGH